MRTDREASPASPPVAVITAPKALKRILGSERPMAELMRRVRMMPEAPTRVPATMRRLLSRTKPDAATARPVNEFSSEIRTGTSAPPMGSTKISPSTRANARSTKTKAMLPVTSATMTSTPMAAPTMALITCWPG